MKDDSFELPLAEPRFRLWKKVPRLAVPEKQAAGDANDAEQDKRDSSGAVFHEHSSVGRTGGREVGPDVGSVGGQTESGEESKEIREPASGETHNRP